MKRQHYPTVTHNEDIILTRIHNKETISNNHTQWKDNNICTKSFAVKNSNFHFHQNAIFILHMLSNTTLQWRIIKNKQSLKYDTCILLTKAKPYMCTCTTIGTPTTTTTTTTTIIITIVLLPYTHYMRITVQMLRNIMLDPNWISGRIHWK